MAGRFVRSSKFRHVFGTPNKKENCYDNVRITKSPHESNMCSVNGKFVAVVLESQGGGAFTVFPLAKVGRFDINYPKVAGHKSLVLDISWNPFNDNEIASCSEDCNVMIWHIPDEGLPGVMEAKDAIQTLSGHQRKVGHIQWHPTAENVLASASFDHTILIWNTATADQLFCLECHSDQIYSISWNYNGSLLATTCKDKKIRILDPRRGEVVHEGKGHQGTKPSKVVFCGTTNKLYSTGFTRMSERQHAVWDADNLNEPLCIENIDTGSGVLFPFWDEGTKMVYIAGKGDTQIRYFEITAEKPYCFFLNMYQSTAPQRGMGCMPKRHMDYMHCEVMRFFKLQIKGMIEPISMTVPRKSEMFQDDIYPPTDAGKPALTAEEWAGGKNCDPIQVAFTKEGLKPVTPKPSHQDARKPPPGDRAVAKQRSSGSVGSRSSSKEGTPPREPQTLKEYKEAYRELLAENERLKKQLAESQSAYKH